MRVAIAVWTVSALWRRALASLAVGGALWCGVASAAGDGLLGPAAEGLSAERRAELAADPYVMRWRVAGMDRDAVFEARAGAEPLVVNLFGDVEVRARVRSAKTLAGGSRWLAGGLEGGGHFTLFRHATGIVRGEFHSARGAYTLRSHGPGRVLVRQEDVSRMPGCGNDGLAMVDDALAPRAAGNGTRGLAPKTQPLAKAYAAKRSPGGVPAASVAPMPIDVLVLYTQRVEDHEGGPAEVQATIENEMAKTNQVLENSGLSHRRMLLAAMEKVDYEQREGLREDISVLRDTVERDPYYGALDEVFPLIEKHQADLVHLFVRDQRDVCGVASNYNGNAEYWVQMDCENSDDVDLCLYNTRRQYWRSRRIYSVSAVRCRTYIFTHELGHVLGLRHDRGDYMWSRDDAGFVEIGFFPMFKAYAFGHQNSDFSEICQITVMSAGNACLTSLMYGQLQVPYFSNPDLPFPLPPERYDRSSFRTDTPMGVPGDEFTVALDGPANASRAIDEVWDIVARLSEPEADRLPAGWHVCAEEDVPVDTLSSRLPTGLGLGAAGHSESFSLSPLVQGGCPNEAQLRVRSLGSVDGLARPYRSEFASRIVDGRIRLPAWPSDAVFDVRADVPREGGQRLSINAVSHDGACEAPRRALAVVELARALDGGIARKWRGVPRVPIALEQGSARSYCAGAPSPALRRLGDFDGDGKADVLLRHADGRWRYHPMDGSGAAALGSLPTNPAVSVVGVGDFNGDDKDDVLMRLASGTWRYYPMDGRRDVAGRGEVALPANEGWRLKGVGDFNGDGKDDVLLRRRGARAVRWDEQSPLQMVDEWRYYPMDGREALEGGTPPYLHHNFGDWVAGVGDLNGDGLDDVLFRLSDGSWHYLPFHGGIGGETSALSGSGAVGLPEDMAWAAAGIADFDGDGKDDILLRHEDGRWQYRRMDGRNVLAEGEPDAAALPDDPAVWLAGVGDMDGDGKAEVLTRRGHGAWRYSTWDAASGALVPGGEVALASDPAWGVLRGGVADPPEAAAVAVPDAGLREHIARNLGLASGAPITEANMARLRELRAPSANVTDLAGLELAVNLVTLDLSGNEIADVSALSGLGALRTVDLAGNRLADVAALGGLAALAALDLSGNGLVDVSALSGLAALTELDLSGNRIGDVAPLAGLSALRTLHLDGNAIADVSALGGLDRLSVLFLRGNAVGDISPLLDSGLRGADGYVDLRGNPLGDGQLDHVVALREAGAAVLFDDGGHRVALFPSAAAGSVAGFVRVINHSDEAGAVSIEAVDEAGERRGPASLTIGAREALHFNAGDLERGDSARGLRGIGEGVGGWRLVLRSELDIEVLGYARTPDGFVTSLHDLAPESHGTSAVATFNPGSNRRQVSRLRLINPTAWDRRADVSAWDDAGSVRANSLLAPANRTLELRAAQLEAGQAGEGAVDFAGIGDGAGKWRLEVHAPGQRLMSLLQSPTGHLANISTRTAVSPWRVRDHIAWERGGRYRVPLFLAAGRDIQGFLRLVNLHEEPATIALRAIDGAGAARRPVTLTLGGGEVLHFTSTDLENGNAAKGLPGIGAGTGDWHLEASADRRFEALAYARTADGFVTSLHDVAPQAEDGSLWIPFFNPGSNRAQASRLRLVNWGETVAEATITGIDDAGNSPGSAVRVRVPGRSARDFMARELERGEGAELSGALGDGRGKWRLRVSSPGEIQAMSLLGLPTGHITNLSTTPRHPAE